MRELMAHSPFMERQHFLLISSVCRSVTLPLFSFELFLSAEQAGIVSHIEDAPEPDAPRVSVASAVRMQDRETSINGSSELGVPAASEDGQCSCIGVDESQVLRGESEDSLGIIKVGNVAEKEAETGSRFSRVATGEGEQAELITRVHAFEPLAPLR